jgi:hypothetical protein
MVIWLAIEHRTLREQGREIAALQQQLNQTAQFVAKKDEEMSSLVASTRRLQVQTEYQIKELVQLNNEVRRQTNEIETLRGEIGQNRGIGGSVNEQNRNQTASTDREAASNSSRLKILEAYYWTQNRVINVTQQIRDRILGDKLEVIAGNDFRGDPGYGQTKTLTLVYSYDGVTMTNEVREGELLLIPDEQN